MGSTLTPEEKDVRNARRRGIDLAWERERAYVQMGLGTRDWTPEQQKELIETHRVSGYYAHHMSSVSIDPQNASNPDNIQFLTFDEHLAAHDGSFKTNPTHGRYDPETGKTHTFEDGKIEAVEAKGLSEPISDIRNTEGMMTDAAIWEYSEAVDAHCRRAERKVMKSEHLTDKQKEETIAAMRENAENNKTSFIENMEKGTLTEEAKEAPEKAGDSVSESKGEAAGTAAESKGEAAGASSSGGSEENSSGGSESGNSNDDMEM